MDPQTARFVIQFREGTADWVARAGIQLLALALMAHIRSFRKGAISCLAIRANSSSHRSNAPAFATRSESFR
jgi:hypothetical protein